MLNKNSKDNGKTKNQEIKQGNAELKRNFEQEKEEK